jgi:hypothetical protein
LTQIPRSPGAYGRSAHFEMAPSSPQLAGLRSEGGTAVGATARSRLLISVDGLLRAAARPIRLQQTSPRRRLVRLIFVLDLGLYGRNKDYNHRQ